MTGVQTCALPIYGWFHTGDLGRFTDKGQLVLVGRLKNIFKTSYGKYVNPQVIEEKFSESPFIENIVVVGENQKYAAAIISPDMSFLECWCKRHDMVFTTPQDVLKNPKVLARYTKEVNKYNEFFGETEKIKKFELVPEEWSIMNEKPRQQAIFSSFQQCLLLMINICFTKYFHITFYNTSFPQNAHTIFKYLYIVNNLQNIFFLSFRNRYFCSIRQQNHHLFF